MHDGPQSFDEVVEAVTEGMQAGRYADTYTLVTHAAPRFGEEAYWFFYIRTCLMARMGEADAAVTLLEEAEASGHWYGEQVMRQSPSFASLQGYPRFESITARFADAQKRAYVGPLMELVTPTGERPQEGWPTVVALHGNGESLRHTLRHWAPLAERGWLLVALQSSQVRATDSFVWDDRELALAELKQHIQSLLESGQCDPDRLVIAGFSMGGETALWAVLGDEVPSSRFFVVGPGGPAMDDPATWLPFLPDACQRGVRGVIVLGDADSTVPRDAIRELATLLDQRGIPTHLESHPTLAHAFPPDFGATLDQALPFLDGSDDAAGSS